MDQKVEEFLKFHLEPNEWSKLLDYLRAHPDLTVTSTEVKQVEPFGRQIWVNGVLMFGDGFSEPGLLNESPRKIGHKVYSDYAALFVHYHTAEWRELTPSEVEELKKL